MSYNEVVVIAGGTGITPSFQLIKQIVENPADTTHVVLIFANHGAASIPLKEELQALQAKHSNKFTVHFVVNDGSATKQAWSVCVCVCMQSSQCGWTVAMGPHCISLLHHTPIALHCTIL